MSERKTITSYFNVASKSSSPNTPKKCEKSKKHHSRLSIKIKEPESTALKQSERNTSLEYDSDCFIVDATENVLDVQEKPILTKIEVKEELNKNACSQTETQIQKQSSSPNLEIETGNEKSNLIKSCNNITSIQSKYENNLLDSLDIAELNETFAFDETEDTQIKKTYENDTSSFFIAMVHEFLQDESLHYLFTSEELDLTKLFINVPLVESKKIFSRLYWIQWKWHKANDIVNKYLKLCYNNSKVAIESVLLLEKAGLIMKGNGNMQLADWTSVLTRPQLIDICKYFKLNTAKSDKLSMISSIEKYCSSKSSIINFFSNKSSMSMESTVVKKMSSMFGDYIKIDEKAKSLFDRLHLIMYLGVNPAILRDKKLNLLLINLKIGQQYFPAMNLQYDSPKCAFPTRLHFIEFERAHNLYEQVLKLTSVPQCDNQAVVDLCRQCYVLYSEVSNNKELSKWIPPIWLLSFTSGYRYIKALELGIGSFKAFKDKQMYEEAIKVLSMMLQQMTYRQHHRATWYNEKALIYHSKLRMFEKTADVLIHALSEKEITEDAKAPLRNRAQRLALQKNTKLSAEICQTLVDLSAQSAPTLPSIEISARTTDEKVPGRKSQYFFRDIISGDKMYSSVEQYALLHYLNNTDFNNGEHWEGRIITSIFALVFWDIIYAPVTSAPGVYLSPYQEAPLDLYTNMFYENRKDLIENRLMYIEYGWEDINEIITYTKDVFDSRKKGEVSVYNDNIEWDQMVEVIECLGRDGLLHICKRLATSYHYAHSGFPDLTVWNHSTKTIKFVEVKGDGDKLSFKQIQWMTYLIESGVSTEVCYVSQKNKRLKSPEKSNLLDEEDFSLTPIKKSDRKSSSGIKRKLSKDKLSQSILESESPIVEMSVSPEKSKKVFVNSPKGRRSLNSSPKKSPNKKEKLSPSKSEDCHLRSPAKASKGGVGYFVSPQKFRDNNVSPSKNSSPRKKLSLSLTRRRILDKDK